MSKVPLFRETQCHPKQDRDSTSLRPLLWVLAGTYDLRLKSLLPFGWMFLFLFYFSMIAKSSRPDRQDSLVVAGSCC